MYFRLMGKLSARRKAILAEEREKGFTLIELLVVVVIIGVLAAIAIPIYIGVQNGAKDSAAKSDLTNAKTAVIAYYADSNTAAVAGDGSNLANYGYAASAGLTSPAAFTVTDSSTFCITATSASSKVFHIRATGAVLEGNCSVTP